MQIFTKRNKKKGFTLIELLVVIAIIGMLSSIVLVSMGGTRQRARDARRQADIRSISTAMEMCYSDSTCGGSDSYPVWTTAGTTTVTQIDIDGAPLYIGPVADPTNSGSYVYSALQNNASSSGQYYCIFTKLEAPSTATWFCASNRGTSQGTTTTPTIDSCCGMKAVF